MKSMTSQQIYPAQLDDIWCSNTELNSLQTRGVHATHQHKTACKATLAMQATRAMHGKICRCLVVFET
jgi:hypothetical protein